MFKIKQNGLQLKNGQRKKGVEFKILTEKELGC